MGTRIEMPRDNQKGEGMNTAQTFVKTPVGIFRGPLSPKFEDRLKDCRSDEDLFSLVDCRGFIDPDALNEVLARNLYPEYKKWQKKEPK